MTGDATHIVCPRCAATNRVLPDKLAAAKCGKCAYPLFTGRPTELGGDTFDRHVQHNDIPMVVDFWASWCAPCRMMAPEFEKASYLMEPTVRFAKVNTENEPDLAIRYGIQSIPTVILFRGGREVARQPGAVNAEQLTSWIKASMG